MKSVPIEFYPKAVSFSANEMFFSCPYSYYRQKIVKDIPYVEGKEAAWGNVLHGAIERAIKEHRLIGAETYKDPETGKEVTSDLSWLNQYFIPFVRFTEANGYILEAEKEICFSKPPFQKSDWFKAWWRTKSDVVAVSGSKEHVVYSDWKGLPLGTKLPTPTGWTTMGEVREGEQLIGSDGRPCTVVGKSQVKHLPCYKITFDDTSVAYCDNEHLWQLAYGEVVPVTELRKNDRIAVAAPLQLPEAVLPVDPWVLGFWLADGKRTSGEVSKPDDEMWDKVQRLGYELSHDYSHKAGKGKCRTHTILGLRGDLVAAGVFGNKHIPAAYMRASVEQRLALLQGIMDGDGHANALRKQAVLETTSKRFAEETKELALTLGFRPLLSTVTGTGFGEEWTIYMVSFRASTFNPFSLKRKAERLQVGHSEKSWRRIIKSVEPVESMETQCVSVDSPDQTYLCTENFIPTHNTGNRKARSVSKYQKQMRYAALALMVEYPEAQKVDTSLCWIKENGKMDGLSFTRADIPKLLDEFATDVNEIAYAIQNNSWPKKKSGLCRKWCSVKDCSNYTEE